MQTVPIEVDYAKARQLRETDLAWLAGLIDGEGCFHIARRPAGRERVNPSYRFALLITMGCRRTIERVHELTAIGSVVERHASGRWNKAWTWRCGSEALSLILVIWPYLVTKESEARIAIRFFGDTHDLSKNRITLSYLAGIVDGEGSILFSVGRSMRDRAQGRKCQVFYRPVLSEHESQCRNVASARNRGANQRWLRPSHRYCGNSCPI